jgi:aspartyl-tRNA(Asn)/glutamyl-tRNA(Gln) amidotransferase subunit C
MPHFTREDVARLAHLARLSLTADEQDLFAKQLGEFLAYAEHVQAIDTSGIPPTSHALAPGATWRDDEVRPSLPPETAVSAAPEAERAAALFKVPRVIGG